MWSKLDYFLGRAREFGASKSSGTSRELNTIKGEILPPSKGPQPYYVTDYSNDFLDRFESLENKKAVFWIAIAVFVIGTQVLIGWENVFNFCVLAIGFFIITVWYLLHQYWVWLGLLGWLGYSIIKWHGILSRARLVYPAPPPRPNPLEPFQEKGPYGDASFANTNDLKNAFQNKSTSARPKFED